ncbi:phage major capsid protein, HK97 family [Gottschalkia purinilytica]|uniref:Phage major capsid protein, HK97 family n=1 Tax=Gottschalkia purinilytica TaxID=1503 RepID=A0A0L0W6U8_GOTPU|nr:phage major capsid protein [Gottschalkia purinilytica]KNF06970.1 phage major capsid protein, HK97 family [Gottschalkia purinilytica]
MKRKQGLIRMNLQLFGEGKKSTFQLRNELNDFNAEIEKKSAEVIEMATNNKAEEVTRLESDIKNLETCRDAIKSELDKRNAKAQAKAQEIEFKENNETPEQRMISAKAELIRSAITGKELSPETRASLGAIGTTTGGGEKILPTNMAKTLVYEPLAKNQLRDVVSTTNITGLELPKIAYKLDDDDFIGDDETAKELELTGDKITFGRFKSKVFVAISDTVIHGTDTDLVSYVDNALQSGLAAKEKKVMLAGTPKVKEEHMSFYSTENKIKKVQGNTLFEAITGAIADLHEDFRENAKVVMKYSDYITMIKELANGSMDLYKAQPEQIIGKPVVFCDSATSPIVGDFNYAHLNYDGDFIYDTDKDVKTGDYLFVLTAWLDFQLKLKSAFRLAEVKTTTP